MTARPRPPGAWIPWALAGGFAVVVLVNAVMIWLALASWTGLVTDRPYDRGLAYNRNLEAAAAMAGLGWRARLEAARLADGRHELRLEAADRQGAPLAGLEVEGLLERPAHQGSDRAVRLEPAGPGRYRAVVELPAAGLWQAHLRLRRGPELLVVDERLVLR